MENYMIDFTAQMEIETQLVARCGKQMLPCFGQHRMASSDEFCLASRLSTVRVS